jgi:DNA (cytosine-5)-methyltransferase 1
MVDRLVADLPAAAEFFAGIGLARLGLEAVGFRVAWSNDHSADKHRMYVGQFGSRDDHQFVLGDVATVSGRDLPAGLSLAWASFPCTDLSLAGDREGIHRGESKSLWEFTRILGEMADRPAVVALENVTGLATSQGGADLAATVRELNWLGYSVDVLTLDARRFVPQSRPRLLIVGATDPPSDSPAPGRVLRPDWLDGVFAHPTLRTHRAPLPAPPALLTSGLSELVERLPHDDPRWWPPERVAAFTGSLSPRQAERLDALARGQTTTWRTAYRRTRHGVAVWEIRADDVAGCLRTARGGSSKQAVVQAGRTGEGSDGRRDGPAPLKVRWMTPREYARLMGAGDYELGGSRVNQALYGFGDAVCVPVVSWLAETYLLPLVRGELSDRRRVVAAIG